MGVAAAVDGVPEGPVCAKKAGRVGGSLRARWRSGDAARGVWETQRPGTDEEEEERKEGADRTTQQAGGQENELFEVQGPVASRIEAEILAE
ncbi:hypothetical protein RirG_027420 [Rhizophagus irregularis DAOM 197198w]|uniref:Uncharacterized protein n=1 Tax=Rhizophagus irregularis (strain DAOM 197198w) TaxID=1432141 RepID=A0A015LBG6_RHIIW|nr:hypothetical protein RirG_027420 [Rhizophagus irregularis DAOM 197198w]